MKKLVRTCAFPPATEIEHLRYSNAVAELLSPIPSTTSTTSTSPTTPISLLDTLLIGVTLPSVASPGKPAEKTSVSGLVLPLHLRLSTVQRLGGEVEEVLEVDGAEVHDGGGH